MLTSVAALLMVPLNERSSDRYSIKLNIACKASGRHVDDHKVPVVKNTVI